MGERRYKINSTATGVIVMIKKENSSICAALFLIFFFVCANALAGTYAAPVQDGVTWITDQQNPDGSWGVEPEIKFVYTSEAVKALKGSSNIDSSFYNGITWLENHNPSNNDSRARRIAALIPHGDDMSDDMAKLLAAQGDDPTSDGYGWGLNPGYYSSPLDTAIALPLFSDDDSAVENAVNYLQSEQLTGSEKGWAFSFGSGADASSDIISTAIVIRALLPFKTSHPALGILQSVTDATSYLSTAATSSSPLITKAHAAFALLGGDMNSAKGLALLRQISSSQESNGSWGENIYLTALVVQTMNMLENNGWSPRIEFNDEKLRAAVNRALNKNSMDFLTQNEIKRLETLDVSGLNGIDFAGLEYATNLHTLTINASQASEVWRLAGHPALTTVNLKITVHQGIPMTINIHNGSVLTEPSHGMAAIGASGDPLIYTPSPGYTGIDEFSYIESSEKGDLIVTVKITIINSPPVVVDDFYNTPQGIALSVAGPGILSNDTDPDNNQLIAILDVNPADGALVLKADGSFEYTPGIDFKGTDTFTYHANDGVSDSSPATVTIFVGPEHTLFMQDVPQQLSKDGRGNYSGVAVADTILSYLAPRGYLTQATTDLRQESLMTRHNTADGDNVISIIEQRDMLNHWLHPDTIYNYTVSAFDFEEDNYSKNQSWVNRFIMHWLDYDVPDASSDRTHGPAAVVTSSDPNRAGGGAKSDYNHWMTIVGYSSDIDPYTESWVIPNAQLKGFVVIDPAANGIGSNQYIQASEWNNKYFQPIAAGLENEGIYGAVVEPPKTDRQIQVSGKTPEPNPDLTARLEQPSTNYQYRNFWGNQDAASGDADDEIKKCLLENRDFTDMLEFEQYQQAFMPESVGRVIKVESGAGDYALILFEKNDNGPLITTGAVKISLSTGIFQMAFPNPNPDFFDEASRWKAIYNVYAQIGSQPVNAWASLNNNNPLDYGHKVVVPVKNGLLKQFNIYQAERNAMVILLDESPTIELISLKRTSDSNARELALQITDDGDSLDLNIQWPNSMHILGKTEIVNGYIYTFTFASDGKKKMLRVTDKNYRGNDKTGGISYFYVK